MYSHRPSITSFEESQQAQRRSMLERQRQTVLRRRQNQMNSALLLRTTNNDMNHVFRPSNKGIQGVGRNVVSVTSTVSEIHINDGNHESTPSYALQHQLHRQHQRCQNQEHYGHPNHYDFGDRIIHPARCYSENGDMPDGGVRLQVMDSNQRMTHPQKFHGEGYGYKPASGIRMSQLPSSSYQSMTAPIGMPPAGDVTGYHTPQLNLIGRDDQSFLYGQGVEHGHIGVHQFTNHGIRHHQHNQSLHHDSTIIDAASIERRQDQLPLLPEDSGCMDERAMTLNTPMLKTFPHASTLNSPFTSASFEQKSEDGGRQVISGHSSNLISPSNPDDGNERKGSKLKRSHSTRSLTFQEDNKGAVANASSSAQDSSNASQSSSSSTKWNSHLSSNMKGPSFLLNVNSIDDLNLDDPTIMRDFLMKPCPKGLGTLQCFVRRNKGLKNALFPEYRVYLKANETFLMTSKKRAGSKTSNYLISMGRNDLDKNSANIIGKLRSNFLGTEYAIYDDGRNPEFDESYYEDRKCCDGDIRCELGAITYSSNTSLGSKGPRKMKACIGKVDDDGTPLQIWQPVNRCDAKMLTSFKAKDPKHIEKLVCLENKLPSWSDEVGGYVLNFNGRVSKASVKNFQLVEESDEENVILLFGRVGKEEFSLDMKWPMSPFQAFALALSSFDSKLGCD